MGFWWLFLWGVGGKMGGIFKPEVVMSGSVLSLLRQHVEKRWVLEGVAVVLGSLFLGLCSQMRIDVGPVPVTMQTLGVFVLGLVCGAKRGAAACLLYLIEATLGFPVLAGWRSCPGWFLVISSGYLMSFPFAAFVTGWVREQKEWAFVSVLCGQVVIYLFGLVPLVWVWGAQDALRWGLYPFILPGIMKGVIAISMDQLWRRVR